VVCAIPQREANLALQHALRAHGYRGKMALTAHTADDARLFAAEGADLVLRPFAAAAEHTADALLESLRPAAQRHG
jgi:hypothetical protein